MVKGYRRYRRYTKRVSRAAFNKIARRYLKYKVNVNYTIGWSGNSIQYDTNSSSLTMNDILSRAGNEYTSLRGYFLNYKITGILIRITPTENTGVNGEMNRSGTAVMSLVQTGETLTYNTLAQSPNAIQLSSSVPVQKYMRLSSKWTASNENCLPSLKINIAQNNGAVTSIYFNCTFTLYLTFKDTA